MNIAIRRILFPTDFSQPASRAQSYAITLAEQFAAELHVLHVVENPALPVHGSRYSWAVPDDVVPRLIEKAELELALAFPHDVLATIDQRMVRAIEIGHPVTTTIEYAAKHQVDLIVLGTHGRSGLSHLLLGSVAEKVVRLATCPVLTVHPLDQN